MGIKNLNQYLHEKPEFIMHSIKRADIALPERATLLLNKTGKISPITQVMNPNSAAHYKTSSISSTR
ncbi:MAG: hypothetical protein ACI9SB_002360 [Candidatus Azotimanducaceae bacterium]